MAYCSNLFFSYNVPYHAEKLCTKISLEFIMFVIIYLRLNVFSIDDRRQFKYVINYNFNTYTPSNFQKTGNTF